MEFKVMAPLWLKYPSIPQGSIGWRMGYGESYGNKFYSWLYSLSDEEKLEFKEKFPEPICWSLEEFNLKRHNKFWVYNWENRIRTKYSIDLIVTEKVNKIERDKIFFWGHTSNKKDRVGKECLSQWYMKDFNVGHIAYCCMEQYLMSKKALLFGDEESNNKIMESRDQRVIKQLGREVKNFDEKVWNQFKMPIVLTGNYYKFSQVESLRKYLLSTGNKILVEASPYDKIWGIGMGENEARLCEIEEWKGKNLLGFALMIIRDELARLWKFENEVKF